MAPVVSYKDAREIPAALRHEKHLCNKMQGHVDVHSHSAVMVTSRAAMVCILLHHCKIKARYYRSYAVIQLHLQ